MASTATSSPSSFKLALVSCLIFLGLLLCCNSKSDTTTQEDFIISCQGDYLKYTLGIITCVFDFPKVGVMCNPPPECLKFLVDNDPNPKCLVPELSKLNECKGKARGDGIVVCEDNGNTVTFHCNFNATEKFQGRKVHCEIPCISPANETKKYTKLVTSTCDMNIVSTTLPPKLPPTPQAKKSFPTLLAILIATSLAGIIGLMLCCVCRKRRKDKREAEQNRESKRPGTRGKTDLPTQTELSQWTSTDATESTGITSETSVTDIEGETAV